MLMLTICTLRMVQKMTALLYHWYAICTGGATHDLSVYSYAAEFYYIVKTRTEVGSRL